MSDDGIEDDDEFADAGDESELLVFAGSEEAFIEAFERGIMAGANRAACSGGSWLSLLREAGAAGLADHQPHRQHPLCLCRRVPIQQVEQQLCTQATQLR